jgi:V8-like Glu-specific endopeptidase
MTQFQKEGYNLVRKVDYSKVNGKVREQVLTGEDASTRSEVSSSLFSLRMTTDGFEYVNNHPILNSQIEMKDDVIQSAGSYNPMGHRRGLKVIGFDSRTEIMDTSVSPYYIIGAMGYNPDSLLCSGTVIYESAILTAAHCVYDFKEQQWAPVSYFAPGRRRSGGSFIDPYGRWVAAYMTVPKVYTQSGSSSYDYSVVTLKQENTAFPPKFIGDHVGYAGLTEVTGADDQMLDSATITGYLGDKGGRLMWTTGRCPNGFIQDASTGFDTKFVVLHDCDTAGGQSGSSFLGSDSLVRGVHTFAIDGDLPWNGGVLFLKNNGIFGFVMLESGRQTENPPTKPPSAAQPPSSAPSCFASNNMVEKKDIGNVLMSELKVGDHIRAANGDYTQVYGFSHTNHDVETKFLQLFLEDDELLDEYNLPLEITSKHLVFVERNNKFVAIPASDVVVGDRMNPNGKRVQEIRQISRHGIYAPLTFSGDIIVSGVLASNHVDLLDHPLVYWNQHLLGQVVWYPRRLFCQFFLHVCMNESYDPDTGYSTYASWIVWFCSILNQCQWIGATLVNVLSGPLILITSMIESLTMFSCLSLGSIVAIRIFCEQKSRTDPYVA